MLTLSASPDGVLEQGKTYELDSRRALPLIEGGYARPDGSAPAKPAPAAPESGPPVPAAPPGPGSEVPPELEAKTLAQLREYAAENEYDLGGATRRSDVLAAIQAAETGGA